jgi:nitrogen fixation protein NifX
VKVDQPEAITDILDRLIVTLNGSPPPWLRKALTKNEPVTVPDFDEE